MAANATSTFDAARKVTSSLQDLPFDNLIGAPLNACVKAQAEAAQTTINFIQEVGLNSVETTRTDADGKEIKVKEQEAVYVYFNFIQAGRRVTISVPLLTMVPIPYIGINTIDINFKATVTGVQRQESTAADSYEKNTEKKESSGKLGWFKVSTSSLKTNVSTKKDSTSTKNSEYSVEATIDVSVHASQDSMPAGMAKVLEMLGSAMDICDPNGELTVNDTQFYLNGEEPAVLMVSYKTPKGIYNPKDVVIAGLTPEIDEVSGTAIYRINKEGTYRVTSLTSPRVIDVVVKK